MFVLLRSFIILKLCSVAKLILLLCTGVLAFDADGGFYLLHSTPNFPDDPAAGSGYEGKHPLRTGHPSTLSRSLRVNNAPQTLWHADCMASMSTSPFTQADQHKPLAAACPDRCDHLTATHL